MKMKFLIIGDLHGQIPRIHYKNYDAILAPGDFCSSDKLRNLMFEAIKIRLENPKSKIKWYDICGKKKAKDLIEDSLNDGRKILNFLNSLKVPVYLVPGNNDWVKDSNEKWDYLREDHYNPLIKKLDNLTDIHNKIIDIGDYQLVGYGLSQGPEYPQYKIDKDNISKKEFSRRKKEYNKQLIATSKIFDKSSKPTIFLSHNVPFNTSLDKITYKESPKYGYHYGSLVTRKIIEKYQPLVCIGGHMHEHFGKDKIGKTTIINSGFGGKVNTLMELSGNKIKKLEFYKGK